MDEIQNRPALPEGALQSAVAARPADASELAWRTGRSIEAISQSMSITAIATWDNPPDSHNLAGGTPRNCHALDALGNLGQGFRPC